jgi:hypothetical protein
VLVQFLCSAVPLQSYIVISLPGIASIIDGLARKSPDRDSLYEAIWGEFFYVDEVILA